VGRSHGGGDGRSDTRPGGGALAADASRVELHYPVDAYLAGVTLRVAARSKMLIRGRSHTKQGSMLKSRIALRTWAEHDEDPGYMEIDLVAHKGGKPRGRFCFTLTVTDIATGWAENLACRPR
jgi:hypothetical protein